MQGAPFILDTKDYLDHLVIQYSLTYNTKIYVISDESNWENTHEILN